MILVRGDSWENLDDVVSCPKPKRRAAHHHRQTGHITMDIEPQIYICISCRIVYAKPAVPISKVKRVILVP